MNPFITVPPRDKPRKRSNPINFVLPELPNQCYNVEIATEKIKKIFGCLDIDYKVITIRKNEVILNFTALNNTWSNQRRKRRLKKHEEDVCKRKKLEEHKETSKSKEGMSDTELNIVASSIGLNRVSDDKNYDIISKVLSEDNSTTSNVMKNQAEKCHGQEILEASSKFEENVSHRNNLKDQNMANQSKESISHVEMDMSTSSITGFAKINNDMDNLKVINNKMLIEDNSNNSNVVENQIEKCLVKGIIKISSKGSTVVLELEYVGGCAGKEGIHQILQYIKNNWK